MRTLVSGEISQAQAVLCAQEGKQQSDSDLLLRFVQTSDPAAFEIIVRRHGAMVLGVCHRILRNTADAEDAFQLTFLILIRKASSLTSRAILGNWLHGVARRTALNARRISEHRRMKERLMARSEIQTANVRDNWKQSLDEELSQLPEKYRLPILLCDLESWSRREVAQQLGWPEGTVAGRLARGRAMLAKRLSRSFRPCPCA